MPDTPDVYYEPNARPTEVDKSCDFKYMYLFEQLDFKFWRAVAGEFVATAAFLWITLSTVTFLHPASGGDSGFLLAVATAFGLSIAVLVAMFADISGGHINQNISFALFLRGKISGIRCLAYTAAQMVGAVSGAAIVRATNVDLYNAVNGGANQVFTTTNGKAVMAEMIGTSVLIMTVFTVCDSKKSQNYAGWFAIGLAVFLDHLALLGVTNTSVNSSRAFGAAVVSGYWDDHWVWWVGPYLGSVLSALLYELFRFRKGIDFEY